MSAVILPHFAPTTAGTTKKVLILSLAITDTQSSHPSKSHHAVYRVVHIPGDDHSVGFRQLRPIGSTTECTAGSASNSSAITDPSSCSWQPAQCVTLSISSRMECALSVTMSCSLEISGCVIRSPPRAIFFLYLCTVDQDGMDLRAYFWSTGKSIDLNFSTTP